MSTELAVLRPPVRGASWGLSWRSLGLHFWPYRPGRTAVINALATLGFLGIPQLLAPIKSGLAADLLAIGGVAPFLLDGVNALFQLLHDLQDELVWVNAVSLGFNALLWFILGIHRSQLTTGRPWYSSLAALPGHSSLLLNWLILWSFIILLSSVLLVWLLCAAIVFTMLISLLFGSVIKRLVVGVLPTELPVEG